MDHLSETSQKILDMADDAAKEYDKAKAVEMEKLRKLIPHLPFLSPEDRKEIEAEMDKYGIAYK